MAEEVEAVSGAIMIGSRYRGHGSSTDDTAAAAAGDSGVVKRRAAADAAGGGGRGRRYHQKQSLSVGDPNKPVETEVQAKWYRLFPTYNYTITCDFVNSGPRLHRILRHDV